MRWLARVTMALALLALTASGAAAEAFIGLKLADAPAQSGRGALIEEALANGPGALAGLRPNDIVVAVDRLPVVGAAQLSAYIRSRQPNDIVTIEFFRPDGQIWRRLTTRVTLAGQPGGGTPQPGAPTTAGGPPPPPLVGGAASVVSAWTKFTDPYEHAFVMEAPQGWRVEGGIIRGDIVPALRLSSPDGAMSMSLNDPRLRGLFNVPVGVMGEQLNPATHSYLPAPLFIMQYGTSLVGEQCAAPKLRRVRLRPEVAKIIDTAFSARPGQTVAADAIYACARSGRAALAYVFLATHLTPNVGLQFWNVDTVEIAVAPPDRLAGVVVAMSHAWNSIQYSPAWIQLKGGEFRGLNEAAMRSLDESLHQSHVVDNIINGIGDFYNPLTGGVFQAPAGYDRYCQDGAGTVFGTNKGGITPNCQPLSPAR